MRLDAQMPLSFDATAVAFERDVELNAEYLILAEHHDGSGQRLEVQRALDIDQRDYCLVTHVGTEHYGGIVRWEVRGGRLRVTLDADAAAALGADGFDVSIGNRHEGLVRQALRSLVD